MLKSFIPIIILSFISIALCQSINDNRINLLPDTLIGQWVRVKEIQDPTNHEWFRRIKYSYRIGQDTFPAYNHPRHIRQMSFSMVYPETDVSPTHSVIGYFYDWKSVGDMSNYIAYLVCSFVPNYNEPVIDSIRFAMPETDSLYVIIGDPAKPTESFGLKRRRY